MKSNQRHVINSLDISSPEKINNKNKRKAHSNQNEDEIAKMINSSAQNYKKDWTPLAKITEDKEEKFFKDYQLHEKIVLKALKKKYNKKSEYSIYCCKVEGCPFQIKSTKVIPKHGVQKKEEGLKEEEEKKSIKVQFQKTLVLLQLIHVKLIIILKIMKMEKVSDKAVIFFNFYRLGNREWHKSINQSQSG